MPAATSKHPITSLIVVSVEFEKQKKTKNNKMVVSLCVCVCVSNEYIFSNYFVVVEDDGL